MQKGFFHNSTGLGYYSRTLVHSLVETIPDFKAMLFDAHPVKTELTDKYFSNEKVTVATIGSQDGTPGVSTWTLICFAIK